MRAQDEECWKGEEEREAEAARDDGRRGRKHGAIEQLYRSRSGPRRLGLLDPRSRMAHFHLGLPLAHNHPPLSLSAKISKNTGISLYSNRGEAWVPLSSVCTRITRPRLGAIGSRIQPRDLAAWSLKIESKSRGGREEGRGVWRETEGENKTVHAGEREC